MGTAIGLCEDFNITLLRALAKKGRDANQIRRLLALAEIYDGGSRGDVARIGQKNKITRRWARRGTRPSAPHD